MKILMVVGALVFGFLLFILWCAVLKNFMIVAFDFFDAIGNEISHKIKRRFSKEVPRD